MESLGPRLRELRGLAGLSLRELARQARVSPSLVSQIENGKCRPSVSTLCTLARLLDVPVDQLLDAEGVDRPRGARSRNGTSAVRGGPPGASYAGGSDPARPGAAPGAGPTDPANPWRPSEHVTRISVIHPSRRAHLRTAEDVSWERLTATPERDVNFMKITYGPGATSDTGGGLVSHSGYEYGLVLSGTVEVSVGHDVFVLGEGESIGFDSTIPHGMRNTGDVDFQGVWFVHGSHH